MNLQQIVEDDLIKNFNDITNKLNTYVNSTNIKSNIEKYKTLFVQQHTNRIGSSKTINDMLNSSKSAQRVIPTGVWNGIPLQVKEVLNKLLRFNNNRRSWSVDNSEGLKTYLNNVKTSYNEYLSTMSKVKIALDSYKSEILRRKTMFDNFKPKKLTSSKPISSGSLLKAYKKIKYVAGEKTVSNLFDTVTAGTIGDVNVIPRDPKAVKLSIDESLKDDFSGIDKIVEGNLIHIQILEQSTNDKRKEFAVLAGVRSQIPKVSEDINELIVQDNILETHYSTLANIKNGVYSLCVVERHNDRSQSERCVGYYNSVLGCVNKIKLMQQSVNANTNQGVKIDDESVNMKLIDSKKESQKISKYLKNVFVSPEVVKYSPYLYLLNNWNWNWGKSNANDKNNAKLKQSLIDMMNKTCEKIISEGSEAYDNNETIIFVLNAEFVITRSVFSTFKSSYENVTKNEQLTTVLSNTMGFEYRDFALNTGKLVSVYDFIISISETTEFYLTDAKDFHKTMRYKKLFAVVNGESGDATIKVNDLINAVIRFESVDAYKSKSVVVRENVIPEDTNNDAVAAKNTPVKIIDHTYVYSEPVNYDNTTLDGFYNFLRVLIIELLNKGKKMDSASKVHEIGDIIRQSKINIGFYTDKQDDKPYGQAEFNEFVNKRVNLNESMTVKIAEYEKMRLKNGETLPNIIDDNGKVPSFATGYKDLAVLESYVKSTMNKHMATYLNAAPTIHKIVIKYIIYEKSLMTNIVLGSRNEVVDDVCYMYRLFANNMSTTSIIPGETDIEMNNNIKCSENPHFVEYAKRMRDGRFLVPKTTKHCVIKAFLIQTYVYIVGENFNKATLMTLYSLWEKMTAKCVGVANNELYGYCRNYYNENICNKLRNNGYTRALKISQIYVIDILNLSKVRACKDDYTPEQTETMTIDMTVFHDHALCWVSSENYEKIKHALDMQISYDTTRANKSKSMLSKLSEESAVKFGKCSKCVAPWKNLIESNVYSGNIDYKATLIKPKPHYVFKALDFFGVYDFETYMCTESSRSIVYAAGVKYIIPKTQKIVGKTTMTTDDMPEFKKIYYGNEKCALRMLNGIIANMTKVFKSSKNVRTINLHMYAHNGGKFDTYLLLSEILKLGRSDTIFVGNPLEVNKKIISMPVDVQIPDGDGQHYILKLIFKDSLCLMPASLDALCDSFKTKTKKLVGDVCHKDINAESYMKSQNKITKYLINDIDSLYEIISMFSDILTKELDVSIFKCLTTSSIARQLINKMLQVGDVKPCIKDLREFTVSKPAPIAPKNTGMSKTIAQLIADNKKLASTGGVCSNLNYVKLQIEKYLDGVSALAFLEDHNITSDYKVKMSNITNMVATNYSKNNVPRILKEFGLIDDNFDRKVPDVYEELKSILIVKDFVNKISDCGITISTELQSSLVEFLQAYYDSRIGIDRHVMNNFNKKMLNTKYPEEWLTLYPFLDPKASGNFSIIGGHYFTNANWCLSGIKSDVSKPAPKNTGMSKTIAQLIADNKKLASTGGVCSNLNYVKLQIEKYLDGVIALAFLEEYKITSDYKVKLSNIKSSFYIKNVPRILKKFGLIDDNLEPKVSDVYKELKNTLIVKDFVDKILACGITISTELKSSLVEFLQAYYERHIVINSIVMQNFYKKMLKTKFPEEWLTLYPFLDPKASCASIYIGIHHFPNAHERRPEVKSEDIKTKVPTSSVFPQMYTLSKKAENIIRQGYFGGRCEMFGKFGSRTSKDVVKTLVGKDEHFGRIYYYDFTSLYPYMMYKYTYFTGLERIKSDYSDDDSQKWDNIKEKVLSGDKDYVGHLRVFVKNTPEALKNEKYMPLLCLRNSLYKLYAPKISKYSGVAMTLDSRIIQECYKNGYGYMFRIIDAVLYEEPTVNDKKFRIFGGIVEKIYDIKQNAENNKKPALRQVAKIIINSLYGLWGMNLELRETHDLKMFGVDRSEIQNTNVNRYVSYLKAVKRFHNSADIKDGSGKAAFKIIHKDQNIIGDGSFVNVGIASSITQFARLELYKVMIDVQKANKEIIYCDTDSIVTNCSIEPGTELYKKWRAGKPENYNGLGLLTNERDKEKGGSFSRVCVVAPKCYCLEDVCDKTGKILKSIRKFKGTNTSSGKLSEYKTMHNNGAIIKYEDLITSGDQYTGVRNSINWQEYVKMANDGTQISTENLNFKVSYSQTLMKDKGIIVSTDKVKKFKKVCDKIVNSNGIMLTPIIV